MPLQTTAEGVLNDSLQSAVQKRYGIGEIPASVVNPPVSGWNFDYFDRLVSSLPRTPGVAAPGQKDYSKGWMEPLKEHLIKEEDLRTKTYDDGKGNPTVGIGFNLNRPGAREDFKRALGVDDRFFQDVLTGRREITKDQAHALLDFDIPKLHAQLSKDLGGRNLPDNQTVALMSLAFNYGYQGAKKLGILDLLKEGRVHEAVNKTASLPGARSRRIKEAKIMGGLDARLSLN